MDVVLNVTSVASVAAIKSDDSPVRHVFEEIHRWENADVKLASADLLPFISTPAPRLKMIRLTLSKRGIWQSDEHGELFGGHAPELQEVSCVSMTLPWSSFILSGLSTLKLRLCASPTYPEMISLLEASPGLRILELYSLRGSEDMAAVHQSSATSSSKRLAMTDLHTLVAMDLTTPLWAALANIHAPGCRVLQTDWRRLSLPHVVALIAHQLKTTLHGNQLPVTLEIENGNFRLQTTEPDPIFQWNGSNGVDILLAAYKVDSSLEPTLTSRTVNLVIGVEATRTATIDAMLELSCDHLVFSKGSGAVTGDIIQHLADHRDPRPATMSLPFARLKTLEIRGGTGFKADDIIELVEQRRTAAEAGLLQQPLERLTVHPQSRLTEEALWKLEGIMGEGNAEWKQEKDGSETSDEDYDDEEDTLWDI